MNKLTRIIFGLAAACALVAGTLANPFMQSHLHPLSLLSPEPTALETAKYRDLYHRVWTRIYNDYPFRERLASWQEWEHKYDNKMHSLDECLKDTNEMVNSLHDKYTMLIKAGDADADDDDAVSCKLLNGHIGYIKVPSFDKKGVSDEICTAVQYLSSAADELIFDLRGNGGGYVNEAYRAYSLFVAEGSYASVISFAGNIPKIDVLKVTSDSALLDAVDGVRAAKMPAVAASKKLIVLVDGDTASASEMLAGALQDTNRAQLVGTRTFGKAICQSTYLHLPFDASLQITDGFLCLPSGRCMHGVGLLPNYTVRAPDKTDAQLDFAVRLLSEKAAR